MLEFPKIPEVFKYAAHVEKLESSVFPDCNTIERTWITWKKWKPNRNRVYVHHSPGCNWDITRIGVREGRISADKIM